MKKLLKTFTVKDLILIAAMAALGIATKPIVGPIAHIISTPLMLPAGAFAGGLYMMWIVVAFGLTGKRGTATLVAMVQAMLVVITGVTGSHGIMSLVSYTMPGIVVDVVFLIIRRRVDNLPLAFLGGVLSNITGTAIVNMIFFSLPVIPLLLSLTVASLSGGIGGIIAWEFMKALKKFGIGKRKNAEYTEN